MGKRNKEMVMGADGKEGKGTERNGGYTVGIYVVVLEGGGVIIGR